MPLDQDVDRETAFRRAGADVAGSDAGGGAPRLARAGGIDWADLAEWPGRGGADRVGAEADEPRIPAGRAAHTGRDEPEATAPRVRLGV